MLINIVIGLSMMAVCLLLQGVLVVQALRFYASRQSRLHSAFLAGMRVTVGLMFILIVGNVAQVFAWAMLFLWLGEFQQLSVAVYHSAVNFATLGYGDIVMSDENKLLGPLEALNGAMMIGVSTAALTRAFAEVMNDHLPPRAD
ncbi:two pore domain potassium channel family protein [Aestuariicella hydrocarbonica]|uniref:Two pore domain potassium channel family protein n=1 Tax=Pseudomaricurvus hydrocarbonicus TaxID=1470433 RepID=A0A9E5MPA2_9GAMM|nr:ion channel [Aestuariicella hydrocarbonica]NHO67925.1 two pore domain potassium channel family protein [Aestuariicella hydrocarbonica]